MAKKEKKAKDPQEEAKYPQEEKLLTPEKTVTTEGASKIQNELTELIPERSVEKNVSFSSKKQTNNEKKTNYSSFSITDLVSELEKLTKQDNWLYQGKNIQELSCLLYTSPSPRDATLSRMPSSA